MTALETRPATDEAASRARDILSAIKADEEFDAFKATTLTYSSDWKCFTGFPVIERWNLASDKEPLFEEALRALCLKAAVYELTHDENLSEIPLPVPVDEMTHAAIAQPQLLSRITARVGVSIIHQTDQEHTDYSTGDYTHEAYALAWGEPPSRYWLDKPEVDRRLAILELRYDQIGIRRSGSSHEIDFAAA